MRKTLHTLPLPLGDSQARPVEIAVVLEPRANAL